MTPPGGGDAVGVTVEGEVGDGAVEPDDRHPAGGAAVAGRDRSVLAEPERIVGINQQPYWLDCHRLRFCKAMFYKSRVAGLRVCTFRDVCRQKLP